MARSSSDVYHSKICPVCGFQLWFEPWIGDSPADEICPSCGIQFGYHDAMVGDLSARAEFYSQWRHKWIESGMAWWSQRPQPADWNPRAQLERLSHDQI